MAEITAQELKNAISGILKGADLNTLSCKKVRKILEEKYGTDLTERKQEIEGIVMDYITKNEALSESENENEEEQKVASGGSDDESSKPNDNGRVSNASSSGESEIEVPPPKRKTKAPVKKEKKAVKRKAEETKPGKNNDVEEVKSDGENNSETEVVDDEALARMLQDEEFQSRSRAVKKTRVVKRERKPPKEKKVRKENSYTKKCFLSPELAEVVGAEEMARHHVVKKIWDIVKEKNLQDPSNKQFAICDDDLYKLFGKKRIRMFSMMKYLKKHIKAPI